jgi:hypothetical protein
MAFRPAGVDNQTGGKPIPVIPQPDQQPHSVVAIPDVTESDTRVRPAPSVQRDEWDILKAIVYGGLVESVTSLSVVSAAAASGAKTRKFFLKVLHCIADSLSYFDTQVKTVSDFVLLMLM